MKYTLQQTEEAPIRPTFRKSAKVFSTFFLYWVFKTMMQYTLDEPKTENLEELSQKEQCQTLFQRFKKQLIKKQSQKQSIMFGLILALWKELTIYLFLLFLSVAAQTAMPILTKELLQLKENEEENSTSNLIILLVALIIIVKFIRMMTYNQSKYVMRRLGYDAQSMLQVALMEKSLGISFLSNTQHSSGQVINILQVDISKIGYISYYVGFILVTPLQMIVTIYLLFHYVGRQFTIGFIILMICSLINYYLAKLIQTQQKVILKAKDKRTTYTNQVFNSIKFIKMNSYENYFEQHIQQLRQDEIKAIQKKCALQSLCAFSSWTTPILVLLSTFVSIIYEEGELRSSLAFLIIGLTYTLQQPMIQFPQAVGEVISCKLSFERIKNFLYTDEMMKDYIEHLPMKDYPKLTIKNGDQFWKQKTFQLQHINLELEGPCLVGIFGEVGSGKTSLFNAILGEMKYDDLATQPKISIEGKLAYVSQKPWTMNATVKDNILFGKEFDQIKYQEALHYSCLNQDLNILINGDETMIGENGVNLSGGQKTRLALARAIYSEADIFLFDDILSAVDVQVGTFLFQQCLKNYLMNKNKLILLITHHTNYINQMDYIIEIEQGKIIHQGNCDEYKANLEQVVRRMSSYEQNAEVQTSFEDVSSKTKPKVVDQIILKEKNKQQNSNENVFYHFVTQQGGLNLYGFVLIVQICWIISYVQSNIALADLADNSHKSESLDNFDTMNLIQQFIVLSMIQSILTFIRPYFYVRKGVQQAGFLHNKMINSLFKASICNFFERVPIGRILNRLTGDLTIVDIEMNWSFNWIVSQTTLLISATILQVYSGTLFVLIPTALYFIVCWQIKEKYVISNSKFQRLESICKSPILSYFTQIIQFGLPTVRAYQSQDQVIEKHRLNINTHRQVFIILTASSVWFGIMIGLLSVLLNSTVLLYCIFYLKTTAAQIGILLTFSTSLDRNVQDATQAISRFQLNLVSYDRCNEYANVEPEQLNNTKLIKEDSLADWPQKGYILFQNFSIKYRENLPSALKNLSISINPKDKIGVVGRTGAGKSTLTLSILRVLQLSEGSIEIDGINITQIPIQVLRQKITMIMQDSYLFKGSIRDNLDPFHQNSDKEILDALRQCCLQDLLDSRNGLDSQIEDSSINLSEGQKQLLCIARAVLKKSKIILIDEATSNIDLETDKQIQNTIQTCFKDCTVITIAHRIQTILYCNKILVIDEGQVAEFDETQILLENSDSLFYKLYQESQNSN